MAEPSTWRRKEDSWAGSASQGSGMENSFRRWTQSLFDTNAQMTVFSDRTKKEYFNWALPFPILPVQPLKLTVVTERRPALKRHGCSRRHRDEYCLCVVSGLIGLRHVPPGLSYDPTPASRCPVTNIAAQGQEKGAISCPTVPTQEPEA